MEKVKLPREVAEAIERLRSRDFKVTNWEIVYAFANGKSGEYPALIEFANKEFDTFLQALVNDYEVEEPPEDKVRELYDYFGQGDERNYVNYSGKDVQNKIGIILKTLGIKIKGVDD
jgi:hypothetical protein